MKKRITKIKKFLKMQEKDTRGELEKVSEEAVEEINRRKRKGFINRTASAMLGVIYAVSLWGCAPSQYHKPKYHEKAPPAEYGSDFLGVGKSAAEGAYKGIIDGLTLSSEELNKKIRKIKEEKKRRARERVQHHK